MSKIKKLASILLALIVLTSSSVIAAPSRDDVYFTELIKGETTLKAFDYKGITIDGGHMKKVHDEVGSSYLKLADVDNLLKTFRQRAGLPAPGEDPGSWYEDGIYHMFGQIVSGLARYYGATGDIAYKERVDELIHEWALTVEEDGFFFNVKPAKSPAYVYDKMVCGLVDAYIYCGNQQALEYLDKITEWGEKNISNSRHPWNYATEWYTLSENLYRAYLLTNDERYLVMAEKFHYPEYWSLYADKQDIFNVEPWEGKPEHYHAYSHVNTLSGAAMAYLISGEQEYLDIIINAYDFITEEQLYATGGYGPNERLLPREQLVQELYSGTHKNFETQCGSWAAFKLSKYLMTIKGEAKYGHWVELLLYNGIGASLPTHEDGNVMYSSSYQVRGTQKQYAADAWTCCSGTRPQASADYIDHIYFHDDSNLYVNLFTPSTVEWTVNGNDIKLVQSTEFPASEVVNFTIEASSETEFGIRFRKPTWLAGEATASVNGAKVDLTELGTGWLAIDGKWKSGDEIELTLPMELYLSQMLPDKEYPCAIMYGPVVLAVEGRYKNNNPANFIDLDNLKESLKPVPGKPLHFSIPDSGDPGQDDLEVKPFYEYDLGEFYYMYLDIEYSKKRRPSPTPTPTPSVEPSDDPSPTPTAYPTDDPSPTPIDEPTPTTSDPNGDNNDGSPKTGDNITASFAVLIVSMLGVLGVLMKKKFKVF